MQKGCKKDAKKDAKRMQKGCKMDVRTNMLKRSFLDLGSFTNLFLKIDPKSYS